MQAWACAARDALLTSFVMMLLDVSRRRAFLQRRTAAPQGAAGKKEA